jgi:hypothetical protein
VLERISGLSTNVGKPRVFAGLTLPEPRSVQLKGVHEPVQVHSVEWRV